MTVDRTFSALGTEVRLILEEAPGRGPAAVAAQRARTWLAVFDRCASRFRADSELSALNADPRERVPASPLLRATVAAGLWAAHRTGGLVDPVVLDGMTAAGYTTSWDRTRALDLPAALAAAPTRRPAAPDPAARFAGVRVDDAAGVIVRPPGLRLDTGGTGKGLAADALAQLVGDRRAVIDLGGDIALRRPAGDDEPFTIEVASPFGGATSHVLTVQEGGVATSGIDARIWAGPGGAPVHHLLDPASGRPAWTGLVAVTAVAPTALEAEVLAKAALLSGPEGAADWLAEHGGIVVAEDGTTTLAGPLAAPVEVLA